MDDKEKGRIWAIYYPRSGNNRDGLQICQLICRLIWEETKFIFVISRDAKLQRVLDACGIPKSDFDEVDKRLPSPVNRRGRAVS
jgi:hypothetical protein